MADKDDDPKGQEGNKAPDVPDTDVVSRKEYEAIKSAQAGSDRAYQEAKTQLGELTVKFADLEKRTMTDKERAEHEEKQRKDELEQAKRKEADATLRLTRVGVIAELGMPKTFEKYAIGSTEEEIKESLNGLQTLINKTAEELVKQRLKSPGVPRSGTGDRKPNMNTMIRTLAGKER